MRILCAALLFSSVMLPVHAQSTDAMPPETSVSPASKQTAPVSASASANPVLERALREWPEARITTVKQPGAWSYEQGVLLDGMVAQWRATGDGRMFTYVKAAVDRAVSKDGVIRVGDEPFPAAAHSLDNIEMGRSLVVMYRVTQDKRYYLAAKYLHDQLHQQPKNASGGYWHKEIYPDQMWLDGAYMAEPFMANYARTFNHEADMEEVASQLLLMDAKMRDRKTGLLHHGWDESRKMPWADKRGLSPEVWARAMGWYCMALVDVLERMPDTDPQRAAVEDLTRRVMTIVIHYQDPDTGLWWQVMDKGNRAAFTTGKGGGVTVVTPAQGAAKGNFPEASASCMFVYALMKGVRMGVLTSNFTARAEFGWLGIQRAFVKPDGTLSGTVAVAGLGGTPYRSGTFDYYIGERVVDNDAKGVGAYLMASSEMIQHGRSADLFAKSVGKTVLFDAWFNSQKRKTADGREELFHYKLSDDATSGYSFFSRMFQQYGMRTEALAHAPRKEDLERAAVYVIVSPDIPALNPNPHYMDKTSGDAIEAWVKAGGVLMLMENDNQRAEFEHFDTLADRFGIHFNSVIRNEELNNSYENTIVPIAAGTGGIFQHAHKALEKEVCTITPSAPAEGILTDKGDVLMAVARVGRGVVYGNVDPWVYNEYTDGRKLPLGEDNFAGGQELVHWVVAQIPGK